MGLHQNKSFYMAKQSEWSDKLQSGRKYLQTKHLTND
jgi:hypothetical protein